MARLQVDLIGSKASSNPAAPIIGAAGGAAIGGIGTILAINSVKAGQRKQYQQGYDLGASDTVKRQYWILQNLQKGKLVWLPDFCDLWQHQVKDRETVGNRYRPVLSGVSRRSMGRATGQIAGDRKRFWTGARPRRGESESFLTTYWKVSKSEILKRSITASRSCSLGKSG